MKTLCVLALVLLLPTVAAEPNPANQRDTVAQVPNGLHVVEQLDWTYSDGATYDGIARFYAPSAASGVGVSLVQGSTSRPVSGLQKSASSVAGLDAYRIDLRTVLPTVPNGGTYSVVIEYDLNGAVAPLRTWYAPATMTLFVKPATGQTAASEFFTDFIPAGHDSWHSARSGVAANTTYTVTFAPATMADDSDDMTPWLWLAGGVVAGIVIMMVASRAGWVGGPQGKKFSKGGDMESNTMLEARRRTLLAALKELETAHEAKQVPDDAYAPLKEEYKAQAVRVMRSLEEKKEG